MFMRASVQALPFDKPTKVYHGDNGFIQGVISPR
jgi:hypothetical protein